MGWRWSVQRHQQSSLGLAGSCGRLWIPCTGPDLKLGRPGPTIGSAMRTSPALRRAALTLVTHRTRMSARTDAGADHVVASAHRARMRTGGNRGGRACVGDGMKLRAMILSVLTTLGLALVVLAAPPAPAWACDCDTRRLDERADLIVVGTVTDVTDAGIGLAVESVEKGSSTGDATLRFAVGRWEPSCGYAFQVGARYRVNSTAGRTGLCTGIRPLPARVSAPSAVPPAVTARPAPGQPPLRWWLVAGTALVPLVAGLVIVVRRRRGAGG